MGRGGVEGAGGGDSDGRSGAAVQGVESAAAEWRLARCRSFRAQNRARAKSASEADGARDHCRPPVPPLRGNQRSMVREAQ